GIGSADRSPQSNAMLRRRSRGVAEHSQHIMGRAMDTTMPGMPMERIREIGMRLQRGGVGWDPSSNFVHLDVGGIRAWPRMSCNERVGLVPDGKTVHLAADGRTLPRYAEARSEIASRGGVISDVPQPGLAGGFFAWLFGKHDEVTAAPAETVAQQLPAPAQGRRGAKEALHTNGAGSAPDLAAAAGPARVADLELAPKLRGVPEPTRSARETAAAAQIVNDKLDKRAVNLAAVPLPPSRPAQPGRDARLVFAAVPTPPARPASLLGAASNVRAQENERGLAAANNANGDNANASLVRAANLPVVITKGPGDRESAQNHAPAFAADAPLQNSFPTQLPQPGGPAAKPVAQQRVTEPARPDRPKLRGVPGKLGVAFPVPSILGQS